jgi:A/G-specific adenine glycosylase
MLQQTQVATVLPYFERFMGAFPRVEDLAAAPEEEVMKNWAGLGYYSRARNLHRAAQKIAVEGFPKNREDWLSIPGVGPYTAGAIASIALNQVEPLLDGNVERVLSRVFRLTRARGDAAFKRRLWRLSSAAVRAAARAGIPPRNFNQALMELGATVCSPRKPQCPACPLARVCRARAVGDAEAFPPRKAPREWVPVRETDVCLIDPGGRIYVEKRPPGQWRAGLWDLPAAVPGLGVVRGEVVTHHVVTRHKITRVTEVRRLEHKPGPESDLHLGRFINPADPEVALGAAVQRVVRALEREGYFESN